MKAYGAVPANKMLYDNNQVAIMQDTRWQMCLLMRAYGAVPANKMSYDNNQVAVMQNKVHKCTTCAIMCVVDGRACV